MKDKELLEQLCLDYDIDIEDIVDREFTEFNEKGELIYLDLSNLELTEFPEIILEFTQLERLNLSHNFINHIPNELTELTSLQVVQFEGNPETLPSNFRSYLNQSSLPIYMADLSSKTCTWCGEAKGFQVERERTRGELGILGSHIHHVTMIICQHCKYIHHFYADKSHFELGM